MEPNYRHIRPGIAATKLVTQEIIEIERTTRSPRRARNALSNALRSLRAKLIRPKSFVLKCAAGADLANHFPALP